MAAAASSTKGVEDRDDHESEVSEQEIDEAKNQSRLLISKQKSAMSGQVQVRTKLEFQGRLNFTQEENKQEFDDVVTESKRKMQGNSKAMITAVNLENVSVQPFKLFKNIETKRLTQMKELVLHDS